MALNARSEFDAEFMRPYQMDDGLFVRLTAGPMPTCSCSGAKAFGPVRYS